MVVSVHRRRINSEEKAKVVVALWEAECIQFLAAPAILHYRMILKKRIILAQFILFFKWPKCKTASGGRNI